MKIRHMIVISTLLMTSSFIQVALADISTGALNRAVNSAISQGQVHAVIKNGVVTLHGYAESFLDKSHAGRAALKLDGVNRVRNYIIVNN